MRRLVLACLAAPCLGVAGAPVAADPFEAVAQAEPDPFAAALADADAGRFGAAAAGFHALARAGDAEAAYNLALLFATGQGLPQNTAEAAFWAWRARLDGLTLAAPLIATLMADFDTDRRAALAARLEAGLLPRAESADGAAMLALAAVLTTVRPEPDLAAAYGWQSRAAATDTPGAVAARDETLARIAPEARAAAQDAALQAFGDWCAGRAASPPPACAAVAPPALTD